MKIKFIIISFVISTVLFLQWYLSPVAIDNMKWNGGFIATIREDITVFWYLYIPVFILIFLKLMSVISKNEKYQRIMQKVNKIFIVCSIVFYVLYELYFLMLSSIFSHW